MSKIMAEVIEKINELHFQTNYSIRATKAVVLMSSDTRKQFEEQMRYMWGFPNPFVATGKLIINTGHGVEATVYTCTEISESFEVHITCPNETD
jgi:hypothetical protein